MAQHNILYLSLLLRSSANICLFITLPQFCFGVLVYLSSYHNEPSKCRKTLVFCALPWVVILLCQALAKYG